MSAAGWGLLGGGVPEPGSLLVATPLLGDPHFSRTVIYLLEHDGGGSVGVIVNRPSHTPVGQVLPAWHDAISEPNVVFGGGPVQPDGALCLGSVSGEGPGVKRLTDGVGAVDLDGDIDAIATRTTRLRVFAGHSGWAPDQLAGEIAEGAWWVVAGTADDLFSDDPRPMWSRVLRRQRYPLCMVSTFPPDPLVN